jgi:hypothetical protein
MKAASATVMAISQGFTLGFHCTGTPGFGLSTVFRVVPAPAEVGDAGCNSDKSRSSVFLVFGRGTAALYAPAGEFSRLGCVQ